MAVAPRPVARTLALCVCVCVCVCVSVCVCVCVSARAHARARKRDGQGSKDSRSIDGCWVDGCTGTDTDTKTEKLRDARGAGRRGDARKREC